MYFHTLIYNGWTQLLHTHLSDTLSGRIQFNRKTYENAREKQETCDPLHLLAVLSVDYALSLNYSISFSSPNHLSHEISLVDPVLCVNFLSYTQYEYSKLIALNSTAKKKRPMKKPVAQKKEEEEEKCCHSARRKNSVFVI